MDTPIQFLDEYREPARTDWSFRRASFCSACQGEMKPGDPCPRCGSEGPTYQEVGVVLCGYWYRREQIHVDITESPNLWGEARMNVVISRKPGESGRRI